MSKKVIFKIREQFLQMNSCLPPPPYTQTPFKDEHPPPLYHLDGFTHNVLGEGFQNLSLQRFYPNMREKCMQSLNQQIKLK